MFRVYSKKNIFYFEITWQPKMIRVAEGDGILHIIVGTLHPNLAHHSKPKYVIPMISSELRLQPRINIYLTKLTTPHQNLEKLIIDHIQPVDKTNLVNIYYSDTWNLNEHKLTNETNKLSLKKFHKFLEMYRSIGKYYAGVILPCSVLTYGELQLPWLEWVINPKPMIHSVSPMSPIKKIKLLNSKCRNGKLLRDLPVDDFSTISLENMSIIPCVRATGLHLSVQ